MDVRLWMLNYEFWIVESSDVTSEGTIVVSLPDDTSGSREIALIKRLTGERGGVRSKFPSFLLFQRGKKRGICSGGIASWRIKILHFPPLPRGERSDDSVGLRMSRYEVSDSIGG